MTDRHILITGGAGYIGSLLTSELLRQNYRVTLLDTLLFGGESGDDLVEVPVQHLIQPLEGQADAVIGYPVLLEVVGADLLRALPGADL